jgi:glycolate oxidase iron-sulfur subunit
MDLGIPADDLATCVACGLCLPHCPTWRVTGEEIASPRGRIAAMAAVQQTGAPADGEFAAAMEACVQCRGCEAACPSGVPFGSMMATTRAALAERGPRRVPRWQRLSYWVLGHHRLLLAGSSLLGVAQRAGLLPRRLAGRFGLPARVPIRRAPLRASGDDVWLFTGCVMDAWQRPTHRAVKSVIEATGAGVALPGPGAACCGALHEHAGLRRAHHRLARRVMEAFPGDAPILVDSAGCGAALAGYGEAIGTDEARVFSARVLDVHTWLASRLDRLPPPVREVPAPVAVQDPCHLRHVLHAHEPVRTVLGPYATLVELDDDGLCCGAGGAYATVQPELAGDIRGRKVAAVAASGAAAVASANPGCLLHLRAAGLDVRHPCELIAEAADLPVR